MIKNLRISRRVLPHFDMPQATYFLTWRLAKPQPDLTSAERSLIASSIEHFSGERYQLHAWVVMNDHVHVLMSPTGAFTRSQILHSWKSFSANQLQRKYGRLGKVWQEESFDHIIRNESDLFEKWNYIIGNPAKRWPGIAEYQWVSKLEDLCMPEVSL